MSTRWMLRGWVQSQAVLVLAGLGVVGALGLYVDAAIATPVMIGASSLLLACWAWVAGFGHQAVMAAGAVGGVFVAVIAPLTGPSFLGLISALVSLAGLTVGFGWLSGAKFGVSNAGTPSRSCLLRSMACASALHDYQAGDHGERVAEYCVDVGVFLGLPDDDLLRLEWAARLHDVGKVAVSRAILKKPSALTAAEIDAVQRHSTLGADLISEAEPTLAPIARIVRHHHERWDGTGYPVGLRGDAIPLESRIIGVVDMYEALISDRPYRRGITPVEAHKEILTRSGTQFDPDVVAVFDAVWTQGKLGGWMAPGELAIDPAVATIPTAAATHVVLAG